jgi:branched-chain amino acid transport system substrate-binding protein
MKRWNPVLAGVALALAASAACADIKVGVIVSATGPAASLGIPERNTVDLLPFMIAGEKVRYVVLDDASDTAAAVRNLRRLVFEDEVDIVIGSTTSPNSLAMIDVAAETGTPMISMAASSRIVEPVDAKRRWVFKTPQNDAQMSTAIVEHMTNHGVRSVAFLGFADVYGDGWYERFSSVAAARRLQIVANERFGRNDASVTEQVLRLVAARPDAILIAASGTPAALPQKSLKEHGYGGRIYQTHGVANNDFLRVCGRDCEGTVLPAGPVLVASQLPDDSPVKNSAMEYVLRYEAAHGKGSVSTFGAHAWDSGLLLAAAVPVALKKAQPGTKEFRAALRDALENVREVAGAHGIFTMSPTDHLGLDQRSRVMVRIRNGGWELIR